MKLFHVLKRMPDDYIAIITLLKKGALQKDITSRGEIHRLKESVEYYSERYYRTSSALERIQGLYEDLQEKCKPL